VLLIAAETYDRLQARGFPVFYGAFGENFTTRGIDPAGMRAGQRYRVGNVLIELTKVRTPCATLDVFRHPDGRPVQKEIYDAAVKAGDPSSPRWALSGFYASVLQPGLLFPGSPIVLLDHAV
jgi:MOSC domain-containing protein YiiM